MRTTKKSAKSKQVDAPSFDMMKTEHGCVRVSLSTFKDVDRVDIRNYYVDRKSGELLPTRKGISIPVEKVDALVKRIRRIAESAQSSDSE